ncbi:MAG: right-handed parallel beta-helix repeat-containing protein, partial [Candidatus Aenigmarchaeota archaeon]|nr:right-handed parallel beta-helix repeat-containing protein [Candidatus Aenigmarchaeota archaeon]
MNKKTFLTCVLMMSFLLLQNVTALENINKCQTLNVENEHYYLNESIIDDSGAEKCIEITANNVTLDCGGRTIDGINKVNTYGIYSNQDMTVVKNCIVRDWNNGIVFYNANNGTIHNNEPYSNKANGILLKESKYNVLSDNNASYNQYGIKLNDDSNGNEIKDNIATYNKINGIY